MKSRIILFISFFFIAFSCSKKDSGMGGGGSGGGGGGSTLNCTTVPKSFSTNVNPIIQANCTINSGCHASGSNNGPGPLTTYAQIFAARTSIRAAVAAGTMPKNGSLSTADKNSILCWIDSGAPQN